MIGTSTSELNPLLVENLNRILDRFDQLHAILVCTSEGVPLAKVVAESQVEAATSYEYAETMLPAIFAGAAEQVGKLQFGAVKSVTCFFENVVFLHVNYSPLVLTFISNKDASVGALQAVTNQLLPALEPLRKAVENADVH